MTLLASIPCYAQESATPAQPDMMQQLQKVMGKQNSKEALGQALVIGSLLGCTQKTAGKEATEAFYRQIQAVGRTAEGYCKQGHATEARALLLSTFEQHQAHPVVTSALGCYDAQAETIAAIGGAKMAADAANYAKWMRDPALAKKELTEGDLCRGKKVAAR